MANILFIGPNRIGDAVLSTAALEHVLQAHPGAAVTIACGPLAAPLYRATPGLRAIHTVAKTRSRTGGHWLALLRSLRGQRFDLAVDLRGTLTTFFLPVRRRIIHRKSNLLRHKLEELTQTMGAQTRLRPCLHLDQAARDAADTALGPEAGDTLAIGPGANFIGKRWPPDRFAALARRLTSPSGPLPNARIVILGGPEDNAIGKEIEYSLRSDGLAPRDLVGQLDLLACAAVLSRATLFVGNDSGLMHMAAATGVATLGLFGPSDERVYGPTGPRARALRGRAYDEIMAGKYMPNVTVSLMEDLSVDAVEEAATHLLSAGGFAE
jgi:heptosyltransferase III